MKHSYMSKLPGISSDIASNLAGFWCICGTNKFSLQKILILKEKILEFFHIEYLQNNRDLGAIVQNIDNISRYVWWEETFEGKSSHPCNINSWWKIEDDGKAVSRCKNSKFHACFTVVLINCFLPWAVFFFTYCERQYTFGAEMCIKLWVSLYILICGIIARARSEFQMEIAHWDLIKNYLKRP